MASQDSSEYRRRQFNKLFYGDTHGRRRRSKQDRLLESLIDDWQATSFGPGDLKPKQPDSQNIGDIMETVLGQLNLDEHATMRDLIDNWSQLVGAAIAKQCQPRRIIRGCLQVEVASAAQRFAIEPHRRRMLASVQQFTNNEIRQQLHAPPPAPVPRRREISHARRRHPRRPPGPIRNF